MDPQRRNLQVISDTYFCPSELNYCACWGDPHCMNFKDGSKPRPPLSFHSYVGGDELLFQDGDWAIIQTQLNSKMVTGQLSKHN